MELAELVDDLYIGRFCMPPGEVFSSLEQKNGERFGRAMGVDSNEQALKH